MAQPLMSSKVASSSTSIHCVENYPVHPKEVHPHPSISTLRSMTPLLPTSHSYPPVPSMNNANVPVISIDPLYPPRRRPSPPFRLGEDTLILGPGTQFIGVEERTPAFVRIMICQEPFRSKFTMIRSSIWTHGTCVSGWSEWEKWGSRSWLKSVTGSNHVFRGNDSMLTMRCNKKMPMNGNPKKMMERQPHWRTFQATLFLFYFSHDSFAL